MVRPIDLVDGTTYRLGYSADAPTYGLGPWSGLSTWPIIRAIDLVDDTTYHSDDGATYPRLRPINLVDGTTHRLGQWYDPWTSSTYDLMVGPIHLVDDTTYRRSMDCFRKKMYASWNLYQTFSPGHSLGIMCHKTKTNSIVAIQVKGVNTGVCDCHDSKVSSCIGHCTVNDNHRHENSYNNYNNKYTQIHLSP
jgi:hypothetical protein